MNKIFTQNLILLVMPGSKKKKIYLVVFYHLKHILIHNFLLNSVITILSEVREANLSSLI